MNNCENQQIATVSLEKFQQGLKDILKNYPKIARSK